MPVYAIKMVYNGIETVTKKKATAKLYYGRKICHLQTVLVDPADCQVIFVSIDRVNPCRTHYITHQKKLCMATSL